jgi:large subunit ribosomal protein L6
MSRIGKKPIILNNKTEVTITSNNVTVKGPLGELSTNYLPVVEITKTETEITVKPLNEELETMALWGTYASIIKNMVVGVNEGFEKNLIIEGVGYRAEVKGQKVVLSIGFSHQVELDIPNGIQVTVEKGDIKIKGFDKQAVSEFAAVIRSKKKPEPYKGKGIRYADEVIRRKEGKKTV